MMDPNTVIESYVRDVTQRLPGRDRADVAMELRGDIADIAFDHRVRVHHRAPSSSNRSIT